MVNRRKVATVWGVAALLLALVTTACDGDHANAATGPAVSPRAAAGSQSGPFGNGAATSEIRDGTPGPTAPGSAGTDPASSPLYYRDASGHLYEVRLMVDEWGDVRGAEHLRDGSLFARTGQLGADGGESLTLYDGDLAILQDYVQPTGALLAPRPGAGAGPGVQRGGPQRMMAFDDCGDQWVAYGDAAFNLIVAGAWYQATHSAKARTAVLAAAARFVAAWKDLVNCRLGD